ncbi:MAG TPA: HEAT repeat domain-containing protein [Verrucomicrobiales bacterium]|nr:HEAT repeat domain-containing protein [Verrucomicrobiales bacterium]
MTCAIAVPGLRKQRQPIDWPSDLLQLRRTHNEIRGYLEALMPNHVGLGLEGEPFEVTLLIADDPYDEFATVKLDLLAMQTPVPGGSEGRIFPDLTVSLQADGDFLNAPNRAWDVLQSMGANLRGYDVRWSIPNAEKRQFRGRSGELAFFVALGALAPGKVRERIRPKYEPDLKHFAFSSRLEGRQLGGVTSINQKLTRLAGHKNHRHRRVLVAADQQDVDPRFESTGEERISVLRAQSVEDVIEKLQQYAASADGVRRITADECAMVHFMDGGGVTHFLSPPVRSPEDPYSKRQRFIQEIKQVTEDLIGSEFSPRGALGGETMTLDDAIAPYCGSERSGRPKTLVILAGPGAGKTTTARRLAWQAARFAPPFGERYRLSVYVSLRDFASAPEPDLLSYLAKERRNGTDTGLHWPAEEKFWADAFEIGDVVLVLDGIDEVVPSTAKARNLLKSVEGWASKCFVLVTCRNGNFRPLKEFLGEHETMELAPFGLREWDLFVSKHPKGRQNFESLKKVLRRRPLLQELASSPFLLDVIVTLFPDLPATRGELIEQAIKKLLGNGGSPDPSNTEETSQFRVLARAALQLHLRSGDVMNQFAQRELEDAVGRAVHVEMGSEACFETASRYIKRYRSEARLIDLPTRVAGADAAKGHFMHSLFLEFLAAEGLRIVVEDHGWQQPLSEFNLDITCEQLLRRVVWERAWSEVLTFLPGRLGKPGIFFSYLLDTPDDLFRTQATTALRGLGDLPFSKLASLSEWADLFGAGCWQVANAHWRTGTDDLIKGLVNGIGSVVRTSPSVVQELRKGLAGAEIEQRNALRAFGRLGPAIAAAEEGRSTLEPKGSTVAMITEKLYAGDWEARDLIINSIRHWGAAAADALNAQRPSREETEIFKLAIWSEATSKVAQFLTPEKHDELFSVILDLLGSSRESPVREKACVAVLALEPSQENFARLMEPLSECLGKTNPPQLRAKAAQALGHWGEKNDTMAVARVLLHFLGDSQDVWVSIRDALNKLSARLKTTADREGFSESLMQHFSRLERLAPVARVSWADEDEVKEFHLLIRACSHAIELLKSLWDPHTPDTSLSLASGSLLGAVTAVICTLFRHSFAGGAPTREKSALLIAACDAFCQFCDVLEFSPEVIDQVSSCLSDPDWHVRKRASHGLATLGIKQTAHVPRQIYEAQGRKDWFICTSTIQTVGAMGLAAKPSPDLIDRILDSVSNVFDLVEPDLFWRRLAGQQPTAGSYLTERIASIKSSEPRLDPTECLNRVLRDAVIYEQERFADVVLSDRSRYLMGRLGCGARVDQVNLALLDDAYPLASNRPSSHFRDVWVCVHALQTFARIYIPSERWETVACFATSGLYFPEWEIRTAACEALGGMGEAIKDFPGVMDRLLDCLQAEEWCVRTGACAALGKLGLTSPLQRRIAPGLVRCLADEQQPVRASASSALASVLSREPAGCRILYACEPWDGRPSFLLQKGEEKKMSFSVPAGAYPFALALPGPMPHRI